ncbi:hypothetical protein ABIE37_003379 [Arthrobacter bambusae]|uniref:Uncharacterized protein n=1 Tax=Arthrobacter bambusae TaxID=1338426 RepID=A0ABV2P9X7_9MICC
MPEVGWKPDGALTPLGSDWMGQEAAHSIRSTLVPGNVCESLRSNRQPFVALNVAK